MKFPKMPKMPKTPRLAVVDVLAKFLEARSVRQKQIIIGAVIVLAVGADFALLIQPAAKVLFELGPKLTPLRQELKQLKKDMKSRDQIKKDWEEAKTVLEEKETQFVSVDGAPALLENLSSQAQRSGVKITFLEPSETAEPGKSFYERLPIEMRATAGAHELGNFLSELETGKSFFRVKSMQITTNPQNERKHLAQLSLETYKKQR